MRDARRHRLVPARSFQVGQSHIAGSRSCCFVQGITSSGGQAWTGKHDVWLQTQTFDQPGRVLAFDAAYEAMLLTGYVNLSRTHRGDVSRTHFGWGGVSRAICAGPACPGVEVGC